MTTLSQSRKIQSLGSNLLEGVNQIASHSLKHKSLVGFKMEQTVSHGMDDLQAYAKPAFQSFDAKNHGYTSNESSQTFPRELLFSQLDRVH